MAKKTSSPVTEAELRVLESLWKQGAATMGQLRDAIYPGGGDSKLATVQKLLSRLADKGLVKRRKEGPNWMYRATAERSELIGDELRRLADRLSGKSMTPLLTCLVEGGDLDAKERAELRRMLDEEDKAKRGKK